MRNLLRAAALVLPAAIFAVAAVPAMAADAGPAARGGHRSVTELGRSATQRAGLSMAFSRTLDGVTATCGSAVRAALPGVDPLPAMPVAPTTDYAVPMRDPSAVVLLNKQVKDPFGGALTTGMSLDAAPGTPAAVPRLASDVTNCGAVRPVGEHVRRTPVARAAETPVALIRSGFPVTSLAAPNLR